MTALGSLLQGLGDTPDGGGTLLVAGAVGAETEGAGSAGLGLVQ